MEKKMQFFKKCPACGKKLGSQEDKCPYCGFEGLNTVFLSQEDYLSWQETVLNPYKETIQPPRIFAGDPGVLILMPNGDLYGYGNNDTGAFGKENYGMNLTRPQLVAKNVKSAALGYNFSIYLTEEGKVELLGRSYIPLRERFQGISDADEVYASGREDIFWVKYKSGALGVWGENTGGGIAEVTKLPLKEYERIVEEYNSCATSEQMLYVQSYGNSKVVNKTYNSWTSPTMERIEREIQEKDEFRMYAKKYSAANIIIVSDKEKNMSQERETIKTSFDQTITQKSRSVLYKFHMYFQNRYLYHPVAVEEDAYYEPELVKSGSGLIDCDNLDRWGWLYGLKIEYFYYDCSAYIARLSEGGKLEIMRCDQRSGIYAAYEEVADVSVSKSYAYIMTKDRILYQLLVGDFINAKNLSGAERIKY